MDDLHHQGPNSGQVLNIGFCQGQRQSGRPPEDLVREKGISVRIFSMLDARDKKGREKTRVPAPCVCTTKKLWSSSNHRVEKPWVANPAALKSKELRS
jgi:hypothetical protein